MAYRYVPPALRAKGGSNAQASGSHNGNISMPDQASGLRGGERNTRSLRKRSDVMPDEEPYSIKEIDRYFWPEENSKSSLVEHSKTLHDCAAFPGKLAYVLLFKDANPRWETDGIIFTKSSLDLLPADLAGQPDATATTSEGATPASVSNDKTIDHPTISNGGAAQERGRGQDKQREAGVTNPDKLYPPAREHESDPSPQREHQSIAIFTQPTRGTRSYRLGHRSFKFLGYYRITHLEFLEPNTPELTKMLKQKWTITNQWTGKAHERQRDAESWQKSLNLRWAVVKFETDAAADKQLGKPQIERLRDDQDDVDGGREKKSVNDLLRELRRKDGDVNDEKKHENNKIEKDVTTTAHVTQEKSNQEANPDLNDISMFGRK